MKTAFSIYLWFISALWVIQPAYAQAPGLMTEFWIRSEYLGWKLAKSPLPLPLVTSASFSDSIPGAIGQPGTKVLLGNKSVDIRWQNGFKFSAGTTLTHDPRIRLEGSYFLLPQAKTVKTLNTSGEPGAPNLAVPIYDVTGFWGLNGVPGETVYLLPGPLAGDPGFEGHFSLKLSNLFQGAEINCFAGLGCKDGLSFEGLGGLRWVQIQENLTFSANTKTVLDVSFPPGFYNTKDRFKTSNNFFGAQLGVKAQYKRCNWLLNMTSKACLGVLNQSVFIHGRGETLDGNLFYSIKGPAHLVGGVLAQPSNMGKHKRNLFAAIFETNLNVGYQISNYLEIFLGYNIILIGNVARPGDQMNRKINPTLTGLADVSRETVGIGSGPIPFGDSGPAEAPQGSEEPKFHFKTRLFWAQGLTSGFSVRF